MLPAYLTRDEAESLARVINDERFWQAWSLEVWDVQSEEIGLLGYAVKIEYMTQERFVISSLVEFERRKRMIIR